MCCTSVQYNAKYYTYVMSMSVKANRLGAWIVWEAAAVSPERRSARPANVASRREKRDRHNSARHEYCLVKKLVAVVEPIRSKQRREATGIFVIIIIMIIIIIINNRKRFGDLVIPASTPVSQTVDQRGANKF